MNILSADPTTTISLARDREAQVRASYPSRPRRERRVIARPRVRVSNILGKAFRRSAATA